MVTFAYYDFPDQTHECALCRRYDCSKPGEKWLHLLTIEDTPCIGMACLRVIVANGGFTRPERVEVVSVREPTDAEIGAYVRAHFAGRMEHILGGIPDDLDGRTTAVPTDRVAPVAKPRGASPSRAGTRRTGGKSAGGQRTGVPKPASAHAKGHQQVSR